MVQELLIPQTKRMECRTLTVADVADYLGVCTDTIYTMVQEKQIPHFRVRRRILFRQEAIDAWMAQQENKIVEEAVS